MSARQITWQEMEQALAKWGLTTFRTLDSSYWVASKDYWDLVLASLGPYPYGYWAEVSDCDDVAEWAREECYRHYRIKPGIVVNGPHVFNILILPDLTLQLVDAGWSEGPAYVEPGFRGSLYDLEGAKVWH